MAKIDDTVPIADRPTVVAARGQREQAAARYEAAKAELQRLAALAPSPFTDDSRPATGPAITLTDRRRAASALPAAEAERDTAEFALDDARKAESAAIEAEWHKTLLALRARQAAARTALYSALRRVAREENADLHAVYVLAERLLPGQKDFVSEAWPELLDEPSRESLLSFRERWAR